MSWSTPVVHATGDVVTAADWNVSSNDISFLAGIASAEVLTSQTTTTTTYTDLATVGPAVTLTTGANAIVMISCNLANGTAADGAGMSFAVSGATTIAASDNNAIAVVGTASIPGARIIKVTSLTAGSNTFTAKYRAVTAGTATFLRRDITVIPLP